ncbi:pirin family protein [Cupriavidus basilensis]|uniref:Pirin family protein n=1 Tax=Cupriavidus basilensis TaxID=68895 RepID=A0ABT6AKZ1_9BURK|nr:pirin family protein [Cupriavidus basilensis]MDF3833251.1 pirin family protein [Cupriavidus basilensis]
MSTFTLSLQPVRPIAESQGAQRHVVQQASGRRHGPVTRVFSPGDIGNQVKPFVFLDYFDFQATGSAMFPMHPHSGIAMTTVVLSGSMRYEDTTGASSVLEAGNVEWMRAGHGVWHDASPASMGRFRGYQLWVALPAALEHAPVQSQYLPPKAVPQSGPARVILGRHTGAHSQVAAPEDLLVLHVRLRDGERWQLTTEPGHNVGWLHVSQGALHLAGARIANELAVLNESSAGIDVVAEGATEFIVGTAVKHPHPLVLGHYSVHTSPAAPQRGEQEIARLGEQLRARGRVC